MGIDARHGRARSSAPASIERCARMPSSFDYLASNVCVGRGTHDLDAD
jgi:hypothetical protein